MRNRCAQVLKLTNKGVPVNKRCAGDSVPGAASSLDSKLLARAAWRPYRRPSHFVY
jgi:hypothetical protein